MGVGFLVSAWTLVACLRLVHLEKVPSSFLLLVAKAVGPAVSD